jgi:hypothetical protein
LSVWWRVGLKNRPGACSSLLIGKMIISSATSVRCSSSSGSAGSGWIQKRIRPSMKAFTATMSVCATKRIARPDSPIASSSARCRWSDGVEM